MKSLLTLGFALLASNFAHAGIPRLDASCPGNINLRTDEGGVAYINGKAVKLKAFSESYFEAKGAGVTVSISVDDDGAVDVAYTGKHGANGFCKLEKVSKDAAGAVNSKQAAILTSIPPGLSNTCRGEAASMFSLKPMYVTVGKPTRTSTGFAVGGLGDLGDEGKKPFRCIFDAKGKYKNFESLVDEGEL